MNAPFDPNLHGSMKDGAPISPLASTSEKRKSSGSLLTYTIFALGLALFIRFFIAAPYVVQGQSMEPTFENWNYLIVDRLSYDIGEPQRGDVIVFDLPQNSSRALIKRIIGLPGEEVILAGNEVRIVNTEHPDGMLLDEPYLDPKNLGGATNMRVTLKDGQYFVLGDNRRVSSDSRVWGILPKEDIVGRVFLRLYPPKEVGFLPGTFRFQK